MRHIDADALKDAIMQEVYKDRVGVFVGRRIFKLINNAPTVEIPVARWDCYCEGQKVGYEKALSERPQGEWIDVKDIPYLANCSCCGYQMDTHEEHGYFNHCPYCGADMRGGKE